MAIFTIEASEREDFEKWLKEHDAKVRADAIEECIKTLAESEDTILSDRQYYTLMELKEQK